MEVAKSLRRRFGYTLRDSFDLWMIYNKAAIQNSAGLCKVVTSHKAILENPMEEALRISEEITKCGVSEPPSTITKQIVEKLVPSNHDVETNSALQILEKYGDCEIPSYKSKSQNNIEVDAYLKAMRIYCDLENGSAYASTYAWPELRSQLKMTIEQKPQIENQLRKMYHKCIDRKDEENEENDAYYSQDEGEGEDVWACIGKPPTQGTHSLARFIIFQRDLGSKLQDLVAYYTSVVPYESLVIIDHDGVDQSTQLNLRHYADRGAHIWKCEGSFDYKAEMWTEVIQHYKSTSDFLFPIDGDEYLTVLRHDGENKSLHWTYEDLLRELTYLQEKGKKGLPFKTLRSVPIPVDCNLEDHPGKGSMKNYGHDHHVGFAPSPMCQIKYTSSDIRHYCYNKSFYRGSEFDEVDKGNHGIEKYLWPCLDDYGFSRHPHKVKPIPVEPFANFTFTLSNLTLLHLQTNGFQDFVLHRLRGASDNGFNNINPDEGCDNANNGGHYCDGWNSFVEVSFDYYKMKKMYQQEVCMNYNPDISMIFPIDDTFGQLCQQPQPSPGQQVAIRSVNK